MSFAAGFHVDTVVGNERMMAKQAARNKIRETPDFGNY
jgi:hypothetical protein